MSLAERLPPSILGGDPFNHFRFLYRKEFWWRLHDEEYCLSVMRAAYEAGGNAFDLSFEVNARLFARLAAETGDALVGFGNPTWEQGVMLNGRFLRYSQDRILRTLVERLWPRSIASLVQERLCREDVLVFGFDGEAAPLTDEEIESIALDEEAFRRRLSIFRHCHYVCFGGSDADWLISLGRMDILAKMATVVRELAFTPILLCQYATLVVPQAEASALDVEGYAVPLNKAWSWFNRNECVRMVRSLEKPVIAFMPLASGRLLGDVRGALDWLYAEVGVESILFGTATAEHARETTRLAREARDAADISARSPARRSYALD
ncbi:MAG: hypothetical protein NTY23_01900 [Chloroflexi bacterium]|nr:hypothetical protein [Chloroflexota bacterium]